MTSRVALVLLQALGAVSILPYPAILIANIMSMAAEGPRGIKRFRAALPYGLLSLYPIVWIQLYTWSWRLMGRGATGRAFALSSMPLELSLVALAAWIVSGRPQRQREAAQALAVRAEVENANPLVWTILSAGGSRQVVGAPRLAIDATLDAIREAPDLHSPAPGYGTPLQAALRNLWYDIDGTPHDRRQKGLIRLVHALMARGAQLSPEEINDLRNSWLLRVAMLEEPVTTRTENPLVWRILKQTAASEPFALHPEEVPLLNRSTRLHGTPLYAAMLRAGNPPALMEELVDAGARLSEEEERDPAALAALEQLFRQIPRLCGVYLP